MSPDSSMRAGETLLRTDFFEVVRRPEGLVQMARSDRTFATTQELDRAHEEVERAIAALPRAQLGIVVDLRLAPARNDPEFERAIAPHRQRIFAGFARRAIVVKSVVGQLHVQRYAREDRHDDLRVFTSLPEAIAFARAD